MKYLEEKMLNDNDKIWLQKVVKGTNLKNAEGNQLVKSILVSFVLKSDKEELSEEINE